jgi:prolyl oligopeptidase
MPKLTYPHTATVEQVDDYHGTLVADPYRWLEDTDSPQTADWVKAQNEVTFAFLEKIPARDKLRKRLAELWNFARAWTPVKRGGRYFQLRNSGLQNQNVLYVMEALTADARVLLDPNTLSTDGTVAMTQWEVSPDGKWLAYATSASGSDWLIWRVRNVDTGQDLAEVIEWSKFSGAAWLPDGSGFYYSRYDAPTDGEDFTGVNYFQKLYFHRLGQPQVNDVLVYERPDQKEWGFGATVSDDGDYLILQVWVGTDVRNRLFYRNLKTDGPMIELIPDLEASYEFVDNDGSTLYLKTNLDSLRNRLIAIDTTRPAKENWQTIIPEAADVLESLKVTHGEFVTVYLHDAYHLVRRFDRAGNPLGEIALPTLGSLLVLNAESQIQGNRNDSELFFTFNSFVEPPTVYRYDLEQNQRQALNAPELDFDFSAYETAQTFVTSQDGTRVPMFLIHKRGLTLNGQNPTLLYGYGGFDISLTPIFAVTRLAWLEMGGVFAMANLRGGGEYGQDWHKAGMLHNKQNVFNDFIACAEHLIAHKITNPSKLAVEGRSNGGLLIGACLTQRPDLFGACLPAVGVMDMLRFHQFTIGWAWVSDYGCADDPEQFKTLYSYSPLHNLKPGTHYPPTLITTADHDDRVVPGHSFKFAAALQAAQGGDAPILIRIQTKAGHGFGKPTSILIEEWADLWAFLTWALKMM